jgi:hypothetical protein
MGGSLKLSNVLMSASSGKTGWSNSTVSEQGSNFRSAFSTKFLSDVGCVNI